MKHTPRDPAFEQRVRDSFNKQRFMQTLGATITHVSAGEVRIEFQHREDLTQQHGFVHAGALASVLDSACGYAALSMMEPGTAVLSIEYKINMLAPAIGPDFVATARVERAGRNITVCRGELHSGDKAIALMQATMMSVRQEGLTD